MNKRDRAIADWVRNNHTSEIENDILHCLTAPVDTQANGIANCMRIAFEAGRLFQFNNPDATLHNPNIYLE